MNGVLLDVDVPISTEEAGYELIVISRNVNYASALTGFTQYFLDDVVMLLRPINSTAQRPDIDEISHYVEHLKIILTEDRKSTRLNSSHVAISYAVFCLK